MAAKVFTASITQNPGVDSLIGSALIAASSGITVWLVSKLNLTDPQAPVWIGAAVLSTLTLAATGLWRYFKGTQVGEIVDRALVAGTTAGINMTVQGAALAADGKTPVSINDGTTPPLAPTVATAKEIVKNFGPDEHAITEALNAAQLKGSNP
jgi:hypothetical protein